MKSSIFQLEKNPMVSDSWSWPSFGFHPDCHSVLNEAISKSVKVSIDGSLFLSLTMMVCSIVIFLSPDFLRLDCVTRFFLKLFEIIFLLEPLPINMEFMFRSDCSLDLMFHYILEIKMFGIRPEFQKNWTNLCFHEKFPQTEVDYTRVRAYLRIWANKLDLRILSIFICIFNWIFWRESVKKEEKFTKLNIVESFAPPWFRWSPSAQSAVDIFINVGMIQGAYCFVANF